MIYFQDILNILDLSSIYLFSDIKINILNDKGDVNEQNTYNTRWI